MTTNQPLVVWITGLPQSGKSTLAAQVAKRLTIPHCILDGDEVRAALVPELGYSEADRDSFYATLGNLALLLSKQGIVVLVAATANRRRYRERVREQHGQLIEVYVNASVDECSQRDQKNLYRTDIDSLPGQGVAYEAPLEPLVVASGGFDECAIAALVKAIGAPQGANEQ